MKAYTDALAADAHYTRELERVYGMDACDMRYQPKRHTDPALIAARNAKLAADAIMREAFEVQRNAAYCKQ